MTAIWCTLSMKHMSKPTSHQFLKIAKGFHDKFEFPHCIGALDAKHFRIKRPTHSGSMYFNYKKFYSIVLQAVVDHDGKFIIIEVGNHGSQHDSSTFAASSMYRAMKSSSLGIPDDMWLPDMSAKVPLVFLADGAYPLMTHVLKPFRRPIHGHLTVHQKKFNYKLSLARRIVECAFGQLSKRFNLFNKRMEQDPKFVKIIIKCACLLQNIIIDYNQSKLGFQDYTESSEILNLSGQNNEVEVGAVDNRDKFLNYFKNQ